ncbi:hypothetical protein SESBI_07110 [Sesbania bispinosa]|nr:hypothetical protein SESBI_07110 [Sesbania bispinosa]
MRKRNNEEEWSFGESSQNTKMVRCRKTCYPKWLIIGNENLTKSQISRITDTPFKWLMQIHEKFTMSGKLIRELALRWDECGGGFRIRRRVVCFSPLEVIRRYDLDSIGKYSWGVADFEKLVCSLNRARGRLNESKNSYEIYVTRCTVVLENWVVDQLCLQRPKSKAAGNLFPRFLSLGRGVVRGSQITDAFERNGVFHDLTATNEELEQEVVKEAMRFAPSGYCHWRESIHDLDSLHEEHLQLVAKNKELENRISTLEEELLTLKQAIQSSERNNLSQDEGRRSVEGELEGDYMDMEGPTVDFVSKGFTEKIVTEPNLEESKKHEGSKIYTRLKGQPRKRVLSARVRSPWMTYYRKRKKQEVEGSFKTEQVECIQSME